VRSCETAAKVIFWANAAGRDVNNNGRFRCTEVGQSIHWTAVKNGIYHHIVEKMLMSAFKRLGPSDQPILHYRWLPNLPCFC